MTRAEVPAEIDSDTGASRHNSPVRMCSGNRHTPCQNCCARTNVDGGRKLEVLPAKNRKASDDCGCPAGGKPVLPLLSQQGMRMRARTNTMSSGVREHG